MVNRQGIVALESQLHVFIRLDGGRIDRVRIFSQGCALDAGGLTVHWLSNVSPGDSVNVLGELVDTGLVEPAG